MVKLFGYHLRVPSKMLIVKNFDDQGSLCKILVIKDPGSGSMIRIQDQGSLC